MAWDGNDHASDLHNTAETEENMGSFFGQFKALFIRNIIIKKRDKRKTVAVRVYSHTWE